MNRTMKKSIKIRKDFQDQIQEITTRMNKFIDLHDQLMIERTNDERHKYKSGELDKQIDKLFEELVEMKESLKKEEYLMDEYEYNNNLSMVNNIESILRSTKRKIKEGIEGLGISYNTYTKNSGHFGIEKTFAGNVFTGIFLVGAGYFVYNCLKNK